MRFFGFKWFGQTNPSRLLINILKYFRFLFWICQYIRLFVHSAYSQYIYRFIPRILSIRTDSFSVFSVYKQIHSAYSQYTNSKIYLNLYLIPHILLIHTYRFYPHILSIRTDSFRIFSVQYTYRFIPHIRRMRPNNFECLELNHFHYSF
jgi:hypothetical protein